MFFLIYKKTSSQIDAISIIEALLEQQEKETLLTTFLYFSINYCSFRWLLPTRKAIKKVEEVKERNLTFIVNDYQ